MATNTNIFEAASVAPPRRRFEPMLGLVLLAWCGLYAARLTTLTIRGEESRRARVAYEMLETGDWFVPRQQGIPFADRPPFHEWMIALAAILTGEMTTAAVRLPAISGVLLAAAATYRFTRRFLSPYGAAAAAISFLSFVQVLQLGRLAESEGVFVGVTTAALFGWHVGYRSGRPPWRVWMTTYAWTAAAALTKGPQGAVYVCAAVGLYLLIRRDWRYLFAPGHAAGLALFALLFGGWYCGCALTENAATAQGTVFAMVNMRLANRGSLPMHMLRYPWLLAAAMLPWSPLLLRYAWPGFRRELGSARDGVVFCTAALAATFPSVWLIYGAAGRHYLSMYPCFAVLIGVVLERTFFARPEASLVAGWRWFCRLSAAAAVGGAAVVVAQPWIDADWARRTTLPVGESASFVAAVVASLGVLAWSMRSATSGVRSAGVRFAGFLSLNVLLGAAYVGVAISMLAVMANDHAEQTAAAKRLLPSTAKLVSFGELEHVFTFDFGDPIRLLPPPTSAAEIPADVEYFAYSPTMWPSFRVPAEWDEIAVVSCDRNAKPVPERTVVIGRLRRTTSNVAAERVEASTVTR